MKYTLDFKLECINKYKNGTNICFNGTPQKRKHFMNQVRFWVKVYDDLGIDGLKHSCENKVWTPEERFSLVAKVLAGNSMQSVSNEAHINNGQLYSWVRKYRENGICGLECRKGRKPKTLTMTSKKKIKLSPSEKEELELLRERNKYLEAENAYLKKLDALVTKREAANPKAKKQKSSKN